MAAPRKKCCSYLNSDMSWAVQSINIRDVKIKILALGMWPCDPQEPGAVGGRT